MSGKTSNKRKLEVHVGHSSSTTDETRSLRNKLRSALKRDPILLANTQSSNAANSNNNNNDTTEDSTSSSSSASSTTLSASFSSAAMMGLSSRPDPFVSNEIVRTMMKTTLVDVERCDSTAPAAPSLPPAAPSVLNMEDRALLYTGQPLNHLRVEVISQARIANPTLTREEATLLFSNCDEQLEVLLHAAKHRHETKLAIEARDREASNNNNAEPLTLQQRFLKWLGVVPGSVLKEIEEQVRKEMPTAMPAVRRQEAEKRIRVIEEGKHAAYESYLSDGRACNLLLEAYQENGDEEARQLYLESRQAAIESECRGAENAAERKRRLDDLHRSLRIVDEEKRKMLVDVNDKSKIPIAAFRKGVVQPAYTSDPHPLTGGIVQYAAEGSLIGASGIKGPEEFVRKYTQPSDLTQSSEQLHRTHCEAMFRSLVDVINMTAKLVQVAPSDAVFGPEALHPIDKMHSLIRTSRPDVERRFNINPNAVLSYLELWTRAPELSQLDVDRQLYAHHKSGEETLLLKRLRECNVKDIDVKLSLQFGVEPDRSPIIRAVCSLFHSDHFKEVIRSAEEQTKLESNIEAQRKQRDRDARLSVNIDFGLLPMYAASARQLPTYDRIVLQSYMREPQPGPTTERFCKEGDGCICMSGNISYPLLGSLAIGGVGSASGMASAAANASKTQQGFVCMEFFPGATRESLETEPRRLCILCDRYLTTHLVSMYTQPKVGHAMPQPMTLLQTHAVKCGEGQYSDNVILKVTVDNNKFNGIVKPQVAYSAAHYAFSTTEVNGHRLRCVVELKALDFRLPRGGVTAT